jgi:lysophospholipase L1-like esterase
MGIRLARIAGPTAVLVAVVLATVAGLAVPAAADQRPGFYLDLGASVSLGLQPTGSVPREAPTPNGYADDLVAQQADQGDPLHLVHMGCPGETTASMIEGDGRCYQPPDSQLSDAVAFLRDHFDERGLVTIDVGFDNIARCLAQRDVDEECVQDGLDLVAVQLPQIIDALRDAAGPDIRFIGVGAYDPYLADGIDPSDQAFALASQDVIARLNSALSDGFGDAGVPVADIATAFSGQNERAAASGAESLASLAQRTCELTWMCAARPFGPNIHPNDQGYLTIASAIEAKLPHDGW